MNDLLAPWAKRSADHSTRPASMVMRRWHRSAMLRSCVTSTSVVPCSRLSANISCMMVSPVAKSRLPVGSSASSTAGCTTKARASATRCCSPPDSTLGECLRRWLRPTRASISVAAWRASRRLASSSGSITFSSAVRWPISWKLWNTKPSCCARRAARASSSMANRSWPPSRTVPRVGQSSPAMMASRLLLPEPEAPTMATVSRAARRKSISRRISRVPVESVTDLKTCSTAIIGVAATAWGEAGGGGGGLAAAGMAQAPASRPALVLVLGDSLSAEYGLARGTGWVALLEQQLRQERPQGTVLDASGSGEATWGGRSRLAALLAQHQPSHVVIELGGNDALRGLPLKSIEENLDWMTRTAQQAGAKVLLLGMQVPPNYGAAYADRFAALFTTVAQARKAAVVPFLLKG